MGLTQDGLADRLKVSSNSVARMERGEMIVTPPMALLISYVARDYERARQRASDTSRHESKKLGRASHLRVHGRKQQNPKKSS